MADAEFYPEVVGAPSRQPDLAARVAELERVVATLASLSRERSVSRDDRPDPVALTAALHPGGMRSPRATKRRTPNGATLAMRLVVIDPSASR